LLQAHNKVPEDAWEYHTRKALNDAAYKGLDYVPYSSTMPVQPKTDEPKFMWVRMWFSLQTATVVKLYKLNDFLLSTEEEGRTLSWCEGRT
jgi:hypothetical protein